MTKMTKSNLKIVFLIFFIAFLISLVVSRYFFYAPQHISNNIETNGLILLKEILTRNIICFLGILLCIIISKSMIYIFFMVNGSVLGIFVSKFQEWKYFLAILPHGILEIISYVLLSCIVLNILQKNKVETIDKKYIIISLLLLLFAANIEAFLTPIIVNNVIC